MSIFSGGYGGDDMAHIKLLVWGFTIGLVISVLLPVFAPTPSLTGYSVEDIYEARANLELYTGQSMISQAPFQLAHVYTPYVAGDEYRVDEDGWLYGAELQDGNGDPYFAPSTDPSHTQIGKQSGIRLDPAAKSDVPLFQSTYQASIPTKELRWYYSAANGELNTLGAIVSWFGGDVYNWTTQMYPTWNFSGYRYVFDPMIRINTTDGQDLKAVSDATLSVVWYDLDGQEGISGGLVLYDDKSKGIVANYTAAEICSSYDPASALAQSYRLNFNGTTVTMYILFDPDVRINGGSLQDAWTQGKWTIAFTATSADLFLDITNSNSFSGALGNLMDTYIKLMTMDLPNVSPEWNLVLWILVTAPLAMAIILFLSRFGLAGVGAGILGTVLAGGILL